MFRLRSIRRKLFWSMTLVMAMLGVQAVGGLSGLLSYRNLIRELEREFSSGPSVADVIVAISSAQEPLTWSKSETPEGLAYLQAEVVGRLQKLRDVMAAFHRRIDSESLAPDRKILAEELLRSIDSQLAALLSDVAPHLAAPGQLAASTIAIQSGLSKIQLTLLSMPRTSQGFEGRLDGARSIYRNRFWTISVATVAAILLFCMAAIHGYRWIFLPIRDLHRGASRVAQGDFAYRLPIRGDDEMAQLATKFNQMTARFEEIRDRLDGEVRERTRQALRSERLAGVGFLSAGVAHEINNPLSAIAMAAESLEGRIQEAQGQGTGLAVDDLSVLTQYLGMIQREAFRCQSITQRLLDFSRGQDGTRTPQDLTRIVGEVLDMVGHMSRFRGHQIVFDRTTSIWVTANGGEIKQVILNLVANALESLSGTGRLEIAITEQADEVLLTFSDNGCGMTPHVLENLFEPFFTAKASGKGTGLGLAITHRIVTDHGGRIEASSEGPGQGSTFRVHLPRQAAMSAAA